MSNIPPQDHPDLNKFFPGWKNHLEAGAEDPLPVYRIEAIGTEEAAKVRRLLNLIRHSPQSEVIEVIDRADVYVTLVDGDTVFFNFLDTSDATDIASVEVEQHTDYGQASMTELGINNIEEGNYLRITEIKQTGGQSSFQATKLPRRIISQEEQQRIYDEITASLGVIPEDTDY